MTRMCRLGDVMSAAWADMTVLCYTGTGAEKKKERGLVC